MQQQSHNSPNFQDRRLSDQNASKSNDKKQIGTNQFQSKFQQQSSKPQTQ